MSSLSLRFDRFFGIRDGEASHPGPATTSSDPLQGLVKRLREFRPCNAHCFAAQVTFEEIVATEDLCLIVRATIQSARDSFPLAFRDRPVHYPPCNHIKWQEGRIRLYKAAWNSGPLPTSGWLVDAKAQPGFFIDATLDSVVVALDRDLESLRLMPLTMQHHVRFFAVHMMQSSP